MDYLLERRYPIRGACFCNQREKMGVPLGERRESPAVTMIDFVRGWMDAL